MTKVVSGCPFQDEELAQIAEEIRDVGVMHLRPTLIRLVHWMDKQHEDMIVAAKMIADLVQGMEEIAAELNAQLDQDVALLLESKQESENGK